jgi:hypothetical protein
MLPTCPWPKSRGAWPKSRGWIVCSSSLRLFKQTAKLSISAQTRVFAKSNIVL